MLPTQILALCLLPLALSAPTSQHPVNDGLAPLSIEGQVVGDGYIVVLKDEAVVGGLRAFESHLEEVVAWGGVDVSTELVCGLRGLDWG
jgi:hypothetical protein